MRIAAALLIVVVAVVYVGSIHLVQSVGATSLLAVGSAALVIAAASRAFKSRASRVEAVDLGIATPGPDDLFEPYAFIASPSGAEDSAGRRRIANEVVRRFLVLRDLDSACAAYAARIAESKTWEFDPSLEAELVEGLLARCDFEMAGKVLEHSLATHPAEATSPRVYFNLGYIHVMTRQFSKARSFLRLFLRSSPHAVYRAEARQILRAIERLCGKGGRAPGSEVLACAAGA